MFGRTKRKKIINTEEKINL